MGTSSATAPLLSEGRDWIGTVGSRAAANALLLSHEADVTD
jgi:hypothetical protein